jgi:hypothetical protein
MERVASATERRCTADTKRGRCRVTRGLNEAGLCSMHSGATDPRELGRLSGKRRREPNPKRVPASLREELRSLDPAIVRGAIEQALSGSNESARVSAVKLLADVDAFRKDDEAGCPRCAKFTEAASKESQDKVWQMVSRLVEGAVEDVFGTHHSEALRAAAARRANAPDPGSSDSQAMKLIREAVMRGLDGREHASQDAVETAVGTVLDAVAGGLVSEMPGDVSPERSEAILASLEECGLLVRASPSTPRGGAGARQADRLTESLALWERASKPSA